MAKKANQTERQKNIEEIRKKMEKDFGEGILIGAKQTPRFHEFISTGSIGLDKATGIGGLPKGRIIEMYGPESSGKTTLCLEVMANAHKDKNAYCAFVDAEHALDTNYAENLGVDLDRLEISQPSWGEQALEVASRLVESGEFAVVVVDSVAALVPKAELEGEMGDATMGKHARLMSQAMRKLTAITAKSGTILIFTNQLRDKIGVMFGSPETTTGGNALKFYASIRLDIRRSITKDNSVMNGKEKIGNQTTVKVVKNKVAPPFKEAKFDILYGEGIDEIGEVLDMAVECKVVDKSGTWFTLSQDTTAVQGKDQAVAVLKDQPELFQEIKNKVLESFVPKESEPVEEVES